MSSEYIPSESDHIAVIATSKHTHTAELKNYALILAATSTKTHLHIYSWTPSSTSTTPLPEIEQVWDSPETLGIGGIHKQTKTSVKAYLAKLFSEAKCVLAALERIDERIPLFVLATDGMRRSNGLDEKAEKDHLFAVITEECIKEAEIEGYELECAIITGEEEAVYSWVTANYLEGTLGVGRTRRWLSSNGADLSVVFESGVEEMHRFDGVAMDLSVEWTYGVDRVKTAMDVRVLSRVHGGVVESEVCKKYERGEALREGPEKCTDQLHHLFSLEDLACATPDIPRFYPTNVLHPANTDFERRNLFSDPELRGTTNCQSQQHNPHSWTLGRILLHATGNTGQPRSGTKVYRVDPVADANSVVVERVLDDITDFIEATMTDCAPRASEALASLECVLRCATLGSAAGNVEILERYMLHYTKLATAEKVGEEFHYLQPKTISHLKPTQMFPILCVLAQRRCKIFRHSSGALALKLGNLITAGGNSVSINQDYPAMDNILESSTRDDTEVNIAALANSLSNDQESKIAGSTDLLLESLASLLATAKTRFADFTRIHVPARIGRLVCPNYLAFPAVEFTALEYVIMTADVIDAEEIFSLLDNRLEEYTEEPTPDPLMVQKLEALHQKARARVSEFAKLTAKAFIDRMINTISPSEISDVGDFNVDDALNKVILSTPTNESAIPLKAEAALQVLDAYLRFYNTPAKIGKDAYAPLLEKLNRLHAAVKAKVVAFTEVQVKAVMKRLGEIMATDYPACPLFLAGLDLERIVDFPGLVKAETTLRVLDEYRDVLDTMGGKLFSGPAMDFITGVVTAKASRLVM